MTRYSVKIEVEASETDAARLRQLLPSFLQGEGYTTMSGTYVIEAWLVAATEKLGRQNGHQQQSRGASDWMPQGHTKRRLGRGPVG